MKLSKLFLIPLLLSAIAVQAQVTSQNARRLFSGTGAPSLNCQPGNPWTDTYINKTDHSLWICITAPNTWQKVVGGGATIPTVAQGDLLYGSGVNALSALAKSAGTSMFLKNSGTSNNPAWARPACADLSDAGAGCSGAASPVKATGAEIDTGTDDAKFVTAKAIADSNVAFLSDIPANNAAAGTVPVSAGSTFENSQITDDGNALVAGGPHAKITTDETARTVVITGTNGVTLSSDEPINIGSILKLIPVTFAQLPASPVVGLIAVISDSDTTAWGTTISGGGTDVVIAFYSGAAWKVVGRN